MRNPSHRILASALIAMTVTACSGGEQGSRTILQNKGSDTMVNVAQAWAETYRTVHPEVAVAVSGGGSGTGIASLINGTVDIANASRDIHAEEREAIRKAHGVDPLEHVVAHDAVVFFVHNDNPLSGLNLEQIACIYGEGGSCENWSDVGTSVPSCADQHIIRISRQSNSGTYEFVRDAVLGKGHDFKLGSRDMQGSKDVVDLVSKTPCAIGYSGLGYATHELKALCIAKDPASPCTQPTAANALSRVYPLSRPLFIYTLGEPKPAAREYLAWIQSPTGQKIVADSGFIPIH
jgi:phosphate transport system substrate-binding protein